MTSLTKYLKAFFSFKFKKETCNYYPIKVYIEPTNFCNLKCNFCPHRIMKREKGYMNLKLFKKILNDSPNFIKQVYLFHSGEPLLHPKIGQMILELNKRNIKSCIFTNAHFLTEKKAREIIDVGLDILSVSYHDKNAYENIIKFQKLIANKKKPKLIVQKLECEEDPKFEKFYTRELKNFGGGIDIKFDKNKYYGCFWPYYMISILWNGDVVACCMNYDGKYILGNVKKESLKDIWNNEKTKLLRKIIVNK